MPLDNRRELPAGWERVGAHYYLHPGLQISTYWSPHICRWIWHDANDVLQRHLLRDAAMARAVRYWRLG